MPRQDTESFIRGLENALGHFDGVPRTLILDFLTEHPVIRDLHTCGQIASFQQENDSTDNT